MLYGGALAVYCQTHTEHKLCGQSVAFVEVTLGGICIVITGLFKCQIYCIKSSRADSRVICLKTSYVSETHLVSILREQWLRLPQDGDWVGLRNIGGF
jgi:hypothetical protein